MKLKVFDRILLALLLIVAIVCAFALLGVASQAIPQVMVESFFSLFYNDAGNAWILAGSALVLLAICIKLVFAGRGGKREPEPAAAVMGSAELGSTFVSLSAVDAMVQKHCRAYERVCACHSTLKTGDEGLSVGLRLAVLPDTNIAELSREIQKTLKEYIEGLTGIQVHEVKVLMENATEAQIKSVPVPTSTAFTTPTVHVMPKPAEPEAIAAPAPALDSPVLAAEEPAADTTEPTPTQE